MRYKERDDMDKLMESVEMIIEDQDYYPEHIIDYMMNNVFDIVPDNVINKMNPQKIADFLMDYIDNTSDEDLAEMGLI